MILTQAVVFLEKAIFMQQELSRRRRRKVKVYQGKKIMSGKIIWGMVILAYLVYDKSIMFQSI